MASITLPRGVTTGSTQIKVETGDKEFELLQETLLYIMWEIQGLRADLTEEQ